MYIEPIDNLYNLARDNLKQGLSELRGMGLDVNDPSFKDALKDQILSLYTQILEDPLTYEFEEKEEENNDKN